MTGLDEIIFKNAIKRYKFGLFFFVTEVLCTIVIDGQPEGYNSMYVYCLVYIHYQIIN